MINCGVAQKRRDGFIINLLMIHNQNNQNVAVFATHQLIIKH